MSTRPPGVRPLARRWRTALTRPRPEPAAAVVGLALSGGGASASFHIGALRYLYDVVGITPSVITGTSAGSLLAASLAQAGDHAGQRRALAHVEAVYAGLREPADLLVPREWFTELQRLIPVLARTGQVRGRHAGSVTPDAGLRDVLAVLWGLGRSRPDVDELLRGRHEQSLYRRGPVFDALLAPEVFHPGAVASSGVQLRVAVVGLESGQLCYVRGDGTLVDGEDQPLGRAAVPLVDAVLASCAIPAVYPPVRLAGEHYVDGGTREHLPVEVATGHLGVTRCYAVSSLPPGVPEEGDFAGRDLSAILLRTTAGIMADEIQRQGVARARALGAIVIAPEVSVLGVLEVDPGLLAIAADYGYLRAAEACEHAGVAEQQVVRKLVELRRRIWASEGSLSDVGVGPPGDRAELAPLKDRVRDLVGQVPPTRLPPGASRWWQEWERHGQSVPEPLW